MKPPCRFVFSFCVLVLLCFTQRGVDAQTCFRRGDCDLDLGLSVTDFIVTVDYLLSGGATPPCLDACDSDDSGALDINDSLFVINYLFLDGPAPPPPFPAVYEDPTPDSIGCAAGFDCTGGSVATSITQHGITWSFDGNYPIGQFINGDYWIVGPVSIVSIDPPSLSSNGRVTNGSMINVTAGIQHGWDSALYGPHAEDHYKSWRNVAFGVSPSNPLFVLPGSSLISSISEPVAGQRPGLKTAAVLTVLSSPPPSGSFRPPYAGTVKPLYNLTQVNTSLLRNYPIVGNPPDFTQLAANFEKVWLEHSNYWLVSYQHPTDNLPWYGRDMADLVGQAALLLNLNRPLTEKQVLLIRFIQVGIDLDGLFKVGLTWPALGGYMIGRKFPILFKRHMFGEDTTELGGDPELFSEDDQTFYVLETSPGVINYGYPNVSGYPKYRVEQLGMPEWAHRYWSEEPLGEGSAGHTWFLDGPLWPQGTGHRWCCTARSLTGHYLAAYMMGLDDDWNWPAAFDYQDRYMQIAKGTHRVLDQWTTDMWDAYRNDFGTPAPVPPAWIPADAP